MKTVDRTLSLASGALRQIATAVKLPKDDRSSSPQSQYYSDSVTSSYSPEQPASPKGGGTGGDGLRSGLGAIAARGSAMASRVAAAAVATASTLTTSANIISHSPNPNESFEEAFHRYGGTGALEVAKPSSLN